MLSNERIAILGNGQMGNLYLDYFKSQNAKAEILKTDITDKAATKKAVEQFNPTILINTAAKTNLEWCNEHQLEAFSVNVLGANNLAEICDELGVYFVHLSSGCIFQSVDGNDEKTETSPYDPQAYYSWTKVWAEQLIPFRKSQEFKYLILRPRQPVSANVSNKNMLVKMLTFTRFIDTANTGTVLEDLMDWTKVLLESRATGIYHVANPGWMTPYEIGEMLKEIVNPEMELIKITKEELNKLTPNRRVDTVLNVDKLQALGIKPKMYRERIREVITELKKNLSALPKAERKAILEQTAAESAQRTIVNDVWQKLVD